jgi:antitoxin VapB
VKRVTVSADAIRALASKNTRASARLEGREVPEDHVRSPAVERYIAEQTAKRREPRVDPATEAVESRGDGLLRVLATEIWPLLVNHSAITNAERQQILGDPTAP